MRRSEWILVIYFVYTSVLAAVLPLRPGIAWLVWSVNAAIIATCFLLAWADSERQGRFLAIVRDWFPLPLMPFAYRQMGWFAPLEHTYRLEKQWIVWDRILLNDWGLRAAIESLGPAIPAVLELSYIFVYTVPVFCVATLYSIGRQDRVNAFLTIFLPGIFLAYGQFPFWPSEPPRTVFPGMDAPTVETFLRRFNFLFLGAYGMHTSVFPSAHVSSAFSGALAMRELLPERRRIWGGLLIYAVSVATATVYGRYHYAVDAAAGFGVAVAAVAFGRLFINRPR